MEATGFILAAGLGTRIAELSRHRPKPLLPIARTTAFARAAEQLRASGVAAVVANAAHLAEQVAAAGERLGVAVSIERDGPTGTAGGHAHARPLLGDRAIVTWNGDIVADLDARVLLARMEATGESLVLAVRSVGAPRSGPIGLDGEGRIVRMRDVSFGVEVAGAQFAAIYAQSAALVASLPMHGDIVADAWIPLLARGGRAGSVVYEGRFHDIGAPKSYLECNLDLLEGSPAVVGANAVVEPSVTMAFAVIGEGARVGGNGLLERVVVWPGARARAPLERAIVVDESTVVWVPA
jgi:MurNAc alpha-1-phosphate uridylyltransferase